MATIEVYTKFLCPYCTRAKALLKAKGATFDEIDISTGGPRRAEMLERSGGRQTVPQIFIDGQHVGVLVQHPARRCGGWRAKHDLQPGPAQNGNGSVQPIPVEPAGFGFDPAPGEFADADPCQAQFGHPGRIFGPLGFRPVFGVVADT